jgi:hypothetical protein
MKSSSRLACLRGAVLLCGVVVLSILGALPAHAQRFQYFYGSPNCSEAGRGGVTTSINGGYIAVGESYVPNNCAGPSDVYVVRTNNLGAHMWEYTYDIGGADSATNVIECANGDIVVVGVSATQFPSHCGPTRDAFLMRLDPCGNIIWLNTYGSTATDEIGWEVIEAQSGDASVFPTTAAGDLIVAGSTGLRGNPLDGYLFRVTAGGALIWDHSYDIGPNQRDDYFYALDEAMASPSPSGTTTHDIVAAGGTNYIGTYDALIVRVNGNTGQINFAPEGVATYGTTVGDEDLRSIQELTIGTEAGNLVATGRTSSILLGNSDVYLIKTSPYPCTFMGDRTIGDAGPSPDEGYCIREITATGQSGMTPGDLIVTGYLDAPGGLGAKDVFLQEFTAALGIVPPFTKVYGGVDTDWGWSVAVVTGQSGCRTAGYVVCGFSDSRLDPAHLNDPQQLYLIKTDTQKNSGCNEKDVTTNTDTPNLPGMCPSASLGVITRVCTTTPERFCHIWANQLCLFLDGTAVCQFITCPDCPTTKQHLDEGLTGNEIEMDGAGILATTPNPVRSGSIVSLEYTLPADGRSSVMITDLTGNVVYTHDADDHAGRIALPVSTAGWPVGTYLARLDIDGRMTTRRIVVMDK